MEYNKILDVSEDDERVYFSFYINNYNKQIIAIPKERSGNKSIYIGSDFSSLRLVESERAKSLLSELMARVILNHPASQLCEQKVLKYLE